MIDALLFAVRDFIRSQKVGYGAAECDITDEDGMPPRMGDWFVAVHKGKSRNTSIRNLDEYFDFSLTLTGRVIGPLDRVGDQFIARNVALVPLAQRQGFNAKVEQLRSLLHMNWSVTVYTGQTPNSANDNISAWGTGTMYGFCEPAHYAGCEFPQLKGGDWMGAEPGDDKFAMKAEMRFEGARRMQPQTAPVGPYI